MNKKGPVIIIEDDLDDQEILQDIFKELDYSNRIIFFSDGQSALDYLNKKEILPFIILSDINMPKLDGFALRQKIQTDSELDLKCIPYLFFSTGLNQQAVINAYSTSAQGFFVKPSNYSEIRRIIKLIMDYWMQCAAPNNF